MKAVQCVPVLGSLILSYCCYRSWEHIWFFEHIIVVISAVTVIPAVQFFYENLVPCRIYYISSNVDSLTYPSIILTVEKD